MVSLSFSKIKIKPCTTNYSTGREETAPVNSALSIPFSNDLFCILRYRFFQHHRTQRTAVKPVAAVSEHNICLSFVGKDSISIRLIYVLPCSSIIHVIAFHAHFFHFYNRSAYQCARADHVGKPSFRASVPVNRICHLAFVGFKIKDALVIVHENAFNLPACQFFHCFSPFL